MKRRTRSIDEGEGGDALAFVMAGTFAGVILLPATALLDLKRAAAGLAAALACLGLSAALATDWRCSPGRWLAALLAAWRWALVAVAGYALAQRLGLEPLAAYAAAGSATRAMGSFGNAGYLAAFLCLSWPLLLAWRGSRRTVGLGLVWTALFATQSRAGLLAWILQLGLWAWRAWRGGWRPRQAVWAAALLVPAALLLLSPPSGWARPTARRTLWRAALGLWWQRPWCGWYPVPFAVAFQQHGAPALVQVVNSPGQYAEDPHQLLLAVACRFGAIGLAVFAVAAAWALRLAWRTPSAELAGAWLGLAGLLAESQADRFFFQAGVLVPVLALVAALAWRQEAWSRTRTRLGRWRIPSALLALALGGGCLVGALRPLVDYQRAVGPDLGAGAQAIAPAAGVAPLMAVAQAGHDPGAYERLGAALAARQRYVEAAAAYRQALRLGPSAGRAQNLGNCAMMLGDPKAAEAAFRLAVAMAPRSSDAHFSLGYALYYQRRLKAAVDELDTALRLDPGNANAATLKRQILP